MLTLFQVLSIISSKLRNIPGKGCTIITPARQVNKPWKLLSRWWEPCGTK